MVWETCKVCKEASHNQFASLIYLPWSPGVYQHWKHVRTRTLHTAQHRHRVSIGLTPCLQMMTMYQDPCATWLCTPYLADAILIEPDATHYRSPASQWSRHWQPMALTAMSSTAPLLYHTPITAQPTTHLLPTLLCNTSIAWPLRWPLTSTLTHQTHTYQCERSMCQARKVWPWPNHQPSWQKQQRGGTRTPVPFIWLF